jgi:hypothetical protein
MRMQTDAKAKDGPDTHTRAFDPLIKEHALKILIDYSASTRRKWTAIMKEIFAVSSHKPTSSAPLLTRQDLESWARGDSVLGDEKFRYVFEFLTHPATLARPELAHASALTDPFYRLLRVGRVLGEFYSDFDNSPFIGHRGLFSPQASPDETNARADAMCGIYVGTHRDRATCLSLERIQSEAFFIAHLFTSPTGFSDAADWNLDRYSGYATADRRFLVHLKGVLVSFTRVFSLLPPRDQDPPQYIDVLSDELADKALETLLWSNMEYTKKRLPYINPFDFSFRLSRSKDKTLRDLVDTFRWRVLA